MRADQGEVEDVLKPRNLKDLGSKVRGLLKAGQSKLAGKQEKGAAAPERRLTNRIPLRIPVDACVGAGKFHKCRLVDINLRGFALETAAAAERGHLVAVTFAGMPDVAPPFTLVGEIVRCLPGNALGARVDRRHTSPESMGHYRKLVLYYLRHRPLLEDLKSGYFEGRCKDCGWVGRVGARSPECSRCGAEVERLG